MVAPVEAGIANVDPDLGESPGFGNSKLLVVLGVNGWAFDAVEAAADVGSPGIAKPAIDGLLGGAGMAPVGNSNPTFCVPEDETLPPAGETPCGRPYADAVDDGFPTGIAASGLLVATGLEAIDVDGAAGDGYDDGNL